VRAQRGLHPSDTLGYERGTPKTSQYHQFKVLIFPIVVRLAGLTPWTKRRSAPECSVPPQGEATIADEPQALRDPQGARR